MVAGAVSEMMLLQSSLRFVRRDGCLVPFSPRTDFFAFRHQREACGGNKARVCALNVRYPSLGRTSEGGCLQLFFSQW